MKKTIFTEGYDVNCLNRSGDSPLHIAAGAGVLDSVVALLEFRADANQRSSNLGRTALHIAAMKGHTAIVVRLLENSANISQPDDSGKTPLDLACETPKNKNCSVSSYLQTQNKCVDTLRASGADGWTPLLFASQKGSFKLRQSLKRTLQLKSVLKCIEDGQSFINQDTNWFISKLVRYKNYLDSAIWTWQDQESDSIILSEDAMTIEKLKKSPGSADVSCALGNVDFHNGLHIWEMNVENVQSMCIGIAQGISTGERGYSDFKITSNSFLHSVVKMNWSCMVQMQKSSMQ